MTDSILSLDREHVVIDADRFEQQAEEALRHRELSAYEAALTAYGGELLPENRHEDRCAERRSFLAELRVRLLLAVAEALEARGLYDESDGPLTGTPGPPPYRNALRRH